MNEAVLKENRTVLARPKFHLTESIIDDVIKSIEEKGIFVDTHSIDIDLPDEKDRVFYEFAMEKRNDENTYLVTGNTKHFPIKPFIITPREMLDLILSVSTE